MSPLLSRTFRFRMLVLGLGVTGAIAWALLPIAAERPAPREIVLVVRDMAYYLGDDTVPNPVIRLKRGESIALTLRNDDVGIVHDFTIPAWGVKTAKLRRTGSERIVFTVADTPGSVEYLCTPHSTVMRGSLSIE